MNSPKSVAIAHFLDFNPAPGNASAQKNMIMQLFIVAVILLTTTLAGAAPLVSSNLEDLAPAIQAHIDQDRFRQAFWGIRIESLDSGRVLFTHHADKLLKPASNAKLFTAALALDRLGPDRRLRTSFYARQPPTRSGTIKGDLWVYGRGDFSCAARFHEGDHEAALSPLIKALQRAGIRRIRGGLVGDATYFHGPHFGSGWTWDDLQFYYGAEASPLILEDNVVDLLFHPGLRPGSPCIVETRPSTTYVAFVHRTATVDAHAARDLELYRPLGGNVVHVTGQLPLGGAPWTDAVAVHDAPRWFVTQLGLRLSQQQVRIGKSPRTVDWLSPAEARPHYNRMVEIAAVDSPPLAELVRHMMKPSQNLYAQALFLQVGRQHQARQASLADLANYTEHTEVSAVAELGDFLVELGIPTNSVKLDDGAGLSRRALVTPNAIVTLLKRMDQHRYADAFQSSLPVAGVDGTLRDRMKNTPAAGRVRAKTGSLAHVYTLAGYATTAAGERLVFSFMLNHPTSTTEARADLDFLAVLLAALEEHS